MSEEFFRQEKLEQLAARFDRKASMRETWLSENQRLVSQDNFGTDLASVEVSSWYVLHKIIKRKLLGFSSTWTTFVVVNLIKLNWYAGILVAASKHLSFNFFWILCQMSNLWKSTPFLCPDAH